LLAQRYPDAGCFVVESSPGRLQRARDVLSKPWWHPGRWKAAPTRFEAPPEGSLQMLWANMLLHQVADPQALIAHWHRTLAVDGFLMFSCFGPDTLRELRELYRALGWPAPAHEFTDMHDWGDMLVQAGFAEPVMDMERITLTFTTPQRPAAGTARTRGATCIRAALPAAWARLAAASARGPWPPRRPATAHR
jgi:malonyl-CoA O-methyltransferase